MDICRPAHSRCYYAWCVQQYVCPTAATAVAQVVHDYGHRGVNNDFLVRSCDALVLLYNDHSPHERTTTSLPAGACWWSMTFCAACRAPNG
jgi:hypothetical protein